MPGLASTSGGAAFRWLLSICLPFALFSSLTAQETGQVCVQNFLDQDADGLRDPGERTIARGVSAGLENAAGVTIASLLLEDSPFAGEGVLCFDQLLAGDYQISLRSAEFSSTTLASFAASVRPGAAPPVVEHGVQPLEAAEASGRAQIVIDAAAVNAILRGLIGSLVMVLIMCVIGLLVYLAVIRRRVTRAYGAPPSADSPRKHDPGAASRQRVADDETHAPRLNG